ncbi:hypothetical protein TIFTF001_004398 [Ficus carica]|uniref:Uncharacterized protein n=1 Tax=Ficus carica TaxID=3494 RepID=A0AA88CVX0_FICCA|nr:hypothetical protein TIFTF001_004398 [Ficus carica]
MAVLSEGNRSRQMRSVEELCQAGQYKINKMMVFIGGSGARREIGCVDCSGAEIEIKDMVVSNGVYIGIL